MTKMKVAACLFLSSFTLWERSRVLHVNGFMVGSPSLPLKGSLPRMCSSRESSTSLAMTAKNELVQMIIDGMSTDADSNETSSKKKDPAEIVVSDDIINALLDEKKGFENSPLLDGEWKLVLSQLPSSTITEDAKGEEESETNEDSSKPSAVRRIVSRIGKSIIKTRRFWKQGLTSKSKTFYGDDLLYKGETPVLKNRGLIKLNVKFNPVGKGFDKTNDGKIVLRRIECKVQRTIFQFNGIEGKLPKFSVPLILSTILWRRGGYLDFVYMDKDVLVTRSNKGAIFVHFRPAFLEDQINKKVSFVISGGGI